MTVHLAKVSIPYYTGIPEDVIVNTWHFDSLVTTPGEGEFADLLANLSAFYDTVYALGGALTFAPWVRPALNTLEVYNLTHSPPRSPVYAGSLTIGDQTTTGTAGTPPETAVCLSYQAEVVSGIPQSRRRGRIFLGGFNQPMTAGTTTAFPTVGPTQRDLIADAAAALQTSMFADGWVWVVWSRTNSAAYAVDNGWIDDEPDTQRRRGRDPQTRTLWPN
jgi:hypothetical protein